MISAIFANVKENSPKHISAKRLIEKVTRTALIHGFLLTDPDTHQFAMFTNGDWTVAQITSSNPLATNMYDEDVDSLDVIQDTVSVSHQDLIDNMETFGYDSVTEFINDFGKRDAEMVIAELIFEHNMLCN